jgi:uncharacterized protein YecE (DUF72 family)
MASLREVNLPRKEDMKIFVGTSGYSYQEWKGKFYPEKISPREMLRFYGERLTAVEINNTFYRFPKVSVLESWAQQVPEAFVFAFKAPQVITHIKRLRNVAEQTEYFFRTLSVLDRKLGPVLFQFPKSFPADRAALGDFLALIPGNFSCAFDFRNASWFAGETLDLLRKWGCSLCLEDTDENPAQEIIRTAAWGYLRLRRAGYTEAGLSQWQDKILSQKWEKAFVFLKHEEEAIGPETALRFRELTDSGAEKIQER